MPVLALYSQPHRHKSSKRSPPRSSTISSDMDMPLFPPPQKPSPGSRKLGRPTIYHYPRSRSSYGAIQLLQAAALRPIIIDVTVEPLSKSDVEQLMKELGISQPRDFMRINDPLYLELKLNNPALSRGALIQALIDHPRLMKRPVVNFPYRENGQNKRQFLIAQPPQKLFTVILNETEEEALGLVQRTPPLGDETEADRWARAWSQAEGQYKLPPEEIDELRKQLTDPNENFDFPEETDEMGEGDDQVVTLDSLAADEDEDDEGEGADAGLNDAELDRLLHAHGLGRFANTNPDEEEEDEDEDEDDEEEEMEDDENKNEDVAGEDGLAAYEGEEDDEEEEEEEEDAENALWGDLDDEDEEDEDPEERAKVDAIIKEMALKAVREEERAGRLRRRGREAGDKDGDSDGGEDEDEEEEDRGGQRSKRRRRRADDGDVSEEELAELFKRIMEVAPPPLHQERQRSGRRRIHIPPTIVASTSTAGADGEPAEGRKKE